MKDRHDSLNESTVFSDPSPHSERQKHSNGKNGVLLGALALVLAAGVLLTVILKSKNKPNTKITKTEIIIDSVEKDINTISYTSKSGESFVFLNTPIEGFNSKGFTWVIEGIEADKQDKTTADIMAAELCHLEGTKMQGAEDSVYGFDRDKTIISFSDKQKKYSITIGRVELNGEAYIKFGENVYKISKESAEKLIKEKIDFATREAYGIATFLSDIKNYRSEGGSLERFDSLTLESGGEKITFTENGSDITKETSPYLVNGAFSQNGEYLLSLFTDTLYIDGAYSYFDDEKSIAEFGLDSPDLTVLITVGEETKWFKFKAQTEDNFAVLSDDRHLITKVKKENIPFLDFKPGDFYLKTLLPFSAEDLSSITISGEGISKQFDYINTQTDKKNAVNDLLNEINKINPSYVSDIGHGEKSLSLIFTLMDNTVIELSFFPTDTTKYTLYSNGVDWQITTTAYNKIINLINTI